MKLPLSFLDSPGLLVNEPDELIAALALPIDSPEALEIKRLMDLGLPPITSRESLSVMTGLNLGFIWSLVEKPSKYYRVFQIPKGAGFRQIEAPRVSLKIIQKWLSIHFDRKWRPLGNVHGFVKARSHLSAAQKHIGSTWVTSLDIQNFFPSTPNTEVQKALTALGYRTVESIDILGKICSYQGRLSQGSPASPILSNICLHTIDIQLNKIAEAQEINFTRYADDIVFSGKFPTPENLIDLVQQTFVNTPWRISEHKIHHASLPQRLKVHGLLVHGDSIRLTKGYRKRIRAFKHLYQEGKIREEDMHKILGHLNYANYVTIFCGNQNT